MLPSKSPKIVFLGTRGFPNVQGGVEKHCEQLTVQLARLGCDVTVLTRKPYVTSGITVHEGVKLVALPTVKSRSLEALLHTGLGIFAAWRLKPDLLHLQAIGPAIWAPLARMLGMKVVMTHHGPDYEREKWGRMAKWILRWGERLGVTWSQAVISIAPNITSRLQERYGRPVATIPNGVVLPHRINGTAGLKAFGLEPGRYLLTVGRYVPEKGFCDLIAAYQQWSELNRRKGRPVWKLAIVGRADHASAYSQKIQDLAAATPGVVLTGFQSGQPLRELYCHAGLFVLPSYYEGLPLVLLEALSYGLSCVLSDIPANRAVNIELEEERFFPAGNVAALAKKLGGWSAKPVSAKRREQWRDRLAQSYHWEGIAAQTLALYQTLIKAKPKFQPGLIRHRAQTQGRRAAV